MATTSVMGSAVRSREDPALIRGTGAYTYDIQPLGLLHVAFTRSPFARAKIISLDSAGKSMPEGRRRVHPRRCVPSRTAIGSAHTLVNGGWPDPAGVKHIDMPVRPKRVWAVMQEARV